MKIRKYTEPHIKELDSEQRSLQSFSKTESVNRIIESYQELLLSLNSKIEELTIDLELTREKLGITETRYATLLNFVDSGADNLDINELLDKIDNIEKKLIAQNAELLRFKSKNSQTNHIKSTDSKSEEKSLLVERNNLGNYFNFQVIRNNQEILGRKRKNSLEEQSCSQQWEKAIEQMLDENRSIGKFKEKTYGYLKKFIPFEQRVKVWPFIFENKLGITNNLYCQLQDRRSRNMVEPHVISQIKRDIDRSFNSRIHINNKQIVSREVQEILQTFHLLRPDVSYVQGMTYPVIILLTVVGKIEAFKIFSNLVLCNKFFREMYSFDEKLIGTCWKVFDILLKDCQPEVARHLEGLKIRSEIFLIQWFFTLFSRGHSLEVTMKIWDLLGYQGEVTLYRLSLAIFEIIGKRILPHNYQHTIGLIQSYWSYIDEHKLLQIVINSKLGVQKISKAFQKAVK